MPLPLSPVLASHAVLLEKLEWPFLAYLRESLCDHWLKNEGVISIHTQSGTIIGAGKLWNVAQWTLETLSQDITGLYNFRELETTLVHARTQHNLSISIYEVCSKSIRIGIVVVVHWLGCVCNQSWHVRTCLSNSWHKLQVAAFAQLAVIGRGSNTCVYVIMIFTMCESTKQRICIQFCFKIGKTATETYQLL